MISKVIDQEYPKIETCHFVVPLVLLNVLDENFSEVNSLIKDHSYELSLEEEENLQTLKILFKHTRAAKHV